VNYKTKSRIERQALVACTAIASLGALLLSGCSKEGQKAPTTVQAAAVPVVVAKVEQKTVPVFSELTARTDAAETVEIRARVKAFLREQHFQEGSMVRKGQLLFTLDKREYEAQLQQAKAQLNKALVDLQQAKEKSVVQTAEANLEIARSQLNKADTDVRRLKPLAEQQAVPQQDYDNALASQRSARADVAARQASLDTAKVNQSASIGSAEAAVALARAAIVQAELNMEYCTITSPIDGLIGVRQVAPGNLVGQGEPTLLATVSAVNPMRVYVSISEQDYLKYSARRKAGGAAVGNDLELLLADGSTYPQKGKMIIADRAVDLKTGTLNLVTEFPNPNGLLRPGQFGRVHFAAAIEQNALLVPQKAVTEMQSAKIVYVVGPENKVQLRSVTLGPRVGQDFIITEGVKAGEMIITEGLLKVRPGSVVQPTEKSLTAETQEGAKR
jgi:membrane fusion protein (multidrug efflux system)